MILIALLTVLTLAPQWWIRLTMRRHGQERSDLPGTGAELAQHLINRFELSGVRVERTGPNENFYDPTQKRVGLSPDVHDGRSLTAVAIAAHEVGHAIQFHRDEPVSRLRQRYAPTAALLQRAGVGILWAMPFIGVLVRSPTAIFAIIAVSVGLQLLGAALQMIVLPLEYDASFYKALPILVDGEYVESSDVDAVRQVLQAAAWTYVARSLADILNIGRWLLVLRR